MKIAIFTDSFRKSTDGVATVTKILASEMIKRGHSITIVCPDDNTQIINEKGYKIICLKSHSVKLYREHMICFKTPDYLEKLEDFSKYDLIHLQSCATLGSIGFLIALKYNKPVSSTYHTNLADFASSFFDKDLLLTQKSNPVYNTLARFKFALKGMGFIISKIVWGLVKDFHNAVPSSTVPALFCKKQLRSKGVKNLLVVLNNPVNAGNNVRDYSKKYDFKNKFVILHVGRLSVEKRVNTLIRTISRLKDYPNITAVICSDGPIRFVLESLAKKLKVSNRVRFTGFVPKDELNWLYANCNVVTAFGLYETFNLCAAEGLFHAKPLILSDCGPHYELVKNNGFLVPVNEDEVSVFAGKIIELYNDKKLYDTFSKNSIKLWKNYDYNSTIDRHEAYLINSMGQNTISNKNYLSFIKYVSNLSISINFLLFTLSLKFKSFDKLNSKVDTFLKKLTTDSSKLKKSF